MNMAMGSQIYSKKCTSMKEYASYNKAFRSQTKETIKQFYAKTHPIVSHEHVLHAI